MVIVVTNAEHLPAKSGESCHDLRETTLRVLLQLRKVTRRSKNFVRRWINNDDESRSFYWKWENGQ